MAGLYPAGEATTTKPESLITSTIYVYTASGNEIDITTNRIFELLLRKA